MANRDFIDEDLIKPRDEVRRIKMGPGDEPVPPAGDAPPPDGPVRRVSDLDLPLMARHKQQVEQDTARTTEELERLRQRQEQLERAKRELEDARRKQTDYERGRQELVEHLSQSLITIERQEIKTEQLVELLSGTRKRFRELLDDVQSIRDDAWPEASVRDEIGKALVMVNDARLEYNKAMARIESALGGREGAAPAGVNPVVFEDAAPRREAPRGFGYWLGVGFAVTLPLVATLVGLAVLFVLYTMGLL